MRRVRLSEATQIVNINDASETLWVKEVKPGIVGDQDNKLIACINEKGRETNGFLDENFLERRGYRGYK